MKILKRKFYERDTKSVAKDLLGKILARKIGNELLLGKIVETEAYYGKEDPASRAYSGKPKFVVKLLASKPGLSLVYMVHANWLFNVVAHETEKIGAVLIRAIEPLKGVEIMKKNRKSKSFVELTNGPGKLTQSLKINNSHNGIDLTKKGEIFILENKKENFEIGSGKRIGVTKDLEEDLRFFIKGNKFVSK